MDVTNQEVSDGDGVSLRIWSDTNCWARLLKPASCSSVAGRWEEKTSGGRFPASKWAMNPQISVCSPRGGDALFILLRDRDFASCTGELPGIAARAIGMRLLRALGDGSERRETDENEDSSNTMLLSGIRAGPCDVANIHPIVEIALGKEAGLGGESQIGEYIRSKFGKEIDRQKEVSPPSIEVTVGDPAEGLSICSDIVKGATRALRSPDEITLVESEYASSEQSNVCACLSPFQPILVVPSTVAADVMADFRLFVISREPLELHTVAAAHCQSVSSGWQNGRLLETSETHYVAGLGPTVRETYSASSAGGSRAEDTWSSNPQFAIKAKNVGAQWTLKIHIKLAGKKWSTLMRRRPIDTMFSFCVIQPKASRSDNARRLLALGSVEEEDILHESPFSSNNEQSCVLRLSGVSDSIIVVPATFAVGIEGLFELTFISDCEFEVSEL